MKKVLLTIFISNVLFSSIDFDGHVNDDEWANADKYLIPYEVEPGYNTPAKYKTEAFITNDDNYLYVLDVKTCEERGTNVRSKLQLHQNYPNLFNPTT